jgi:ribose 5-phosphate isomerase A
MAAELSAVERAKQAAAYRAVDEYISNGMVVGVGSGSTIVYAVDRLRDRVRAEGLSVTCIPTSFQAEEVGVAASAHA